MFTLTSDLAEKYFTEEKVFSLKNRFADVLLNEDG